MFASASQSRSTGLPAAGVPAYVRARSDIRAEFIRSGKFTRLADSYEAGGLRLRFPNAAGMCDGVLINTAGGMTGGDQARLSFKTGRFARVRITTQSAEKIYRAEGKPAVASVDIQIDECASFAWIPQETILFNGSGLHRTLSADIARCATALLFEMTVFGRVARQEKMTCGAFRDSWRIRRGGDLIFADNIRLEGEIASVMTAAATGGGARAVATALFVAPDAEAQLNSVRDALRLTKSYCGVSAWNGMLVVRFAALDPQDLRHDASIVLPRLLRAQLPRIWAS